MLENDIQEILFTEEQLKKRVNEIARQIEADYAGKESGHISNLNPKPVVGPLATSEVTADPYIEGAHM